MWTATFPWTLESMVLRFHCLLLALPACDRKLALSDTKEAAKYVVSRRMQVRPYIQPLPSCRFILHSQPFSFNPASRPPSDLLPYLVH